MPFISICIPAYNRPQYLIRLLDSVKTQSYKDFEVIVTDDSPGNIVENICKEYAVHLPVKYFKNPQALGTPENWNEGIRKATGEWIKLMHDDDWFTHPDALLKFADAAPENPEAFIFSSYTNVYTDNKEKTVHPDKSRMVLLKAEPAILMARNFIGPPSVVIHKNDGQYFYDNKLKWLVDIDMYISRLNDSSFFHIKEPLINVGVSDTQVTASVKNNPEVEIPEHFHFLKKIGIEKLKNIYVFDYWWRFTRNFKIKKTADFIKYGIDPADIHPVLLSIIKAQEKIPYTVLKKGIISKLLMAKSFFKNKKKIK